MSQKDNYTFRRAERTDMKAVIEMIQVKYNEHVLNIHNDTE